jgi:DNA-binding FrmR family transcriptional regulator
MAGYGGDKEQVLTRLRWIGGKVGAQQRLVDQDTYCVDVLTQISAVDKALEGVAVGLLDGHLRHCVRDGMAAAAAMPRRLWPRPPTPSPGWCAPDPSVGYPYRERGATPWQLTTTTPTTALTGATTAP